MKRMLVLMLILMMTGIASATYIDVVVDTANGGWLDNNSNGKIDKSDDIRIKIKVNNYYVNGYALDLHVTGPGTLAEYNGGPNVGHAGSTGLFSYSGIDTPNNISKVTDGFLTPPLLGDLVWGLTIHCDGPGAVIVDLSKEGTTRVRTGTTGSWISLAETDLGDLTITQVPEPVTIALLGLGGLFLRRRK